MDLAIGAYGAMRQRVDDGCEWLDMRSISFSEDHAFKLAMLGNEEGGKSWTNANPVKRIARLTIAEMD